MNMKTSWFVMVFTALLLSACGNKSEVAPTAKAPSPSSEQNTPLAAEQSLPPVAADMGMEKTAPSPTDPTPATTGETGTSGKMVDNTKGGSPLSREEGLALAGKSGCLACHKIETKLVGPAWRDVSKRYKGDPGAKARLVAKVKAGGKGNWTEVTGGVAMPPYSPRVSDENIEKLVTFVLSQ
jgi:cytochrome c